MDVVRAMLKAASGSSMGRDFINASNNSKQTPLHISVVKNQTEAIAMLLQHGADSNKQDIDGNTPVHIAASDDHLVDCLQLLLNQRGPAGALKLDERNYDGNYLKENVNKSTYHLILLNMQV